MPEIHTHPIQTISYGTVMGLILFMLFIILLVVVFYFLFADQIAGIYCEISGSQSCFCPNAPPCCSTGNCDLVAEVQELTLAYCANNPCFERCIDPVYVGALAAEANTIIFNELCGFSFVPEVLEEAGSEIIGGATESAEENRK